MRTMSMTVERVGVCKSKALGYAALFHRGTVKRSTKFRVWPVAGDDHFLELDPSQWRDKYEVVQEYKTNEPGKPT